MNWESGLTPFLFFGLPFVVFWAACYVSDRVDARSRRRWEAARSVGVEKGNSNE